MAGRKRKFSIPNEYKLIGFFIIPFILLPFYTQFVNFFGEVITWFLFAVIILWVGYKLVSKTKSFTSVKNHGRKIYSGVNRAAISKIPTVIWGAFAVIGIFLVGVIVGSSTPEQSSTTSQESKRELEYRQVIDGYQDISRLFYMQQQDMDIVTNTSAWQDNPEEISDAIYSYRQKKDEILFQWGRLYELRRKAGLPSDENLRVE